MNRVSFVATIALSAILGAMLASGIYYCASNAAKTTGQCATVVKEAEVSSPNPARLGITIRDVADNPFGIASGAYIESVDEDTAAQDCDLRENDIIISFDGEAIDSAEDLVETVNRKNPGDRVVIGYLRERSAIVDAEMVLHTTKTILGKAE